MSERICREEKNRMRGDLEAVLLRCRELDEMIKCCQTAAKAPDYRHFWQELQGRNRETINRISNFMTRRANR